MQASLIAGDTLAFDTQAPTDAEGTAYKASDGWTMSFRLVPRATGGTPIEFSASADGDDFTASVPSSTTAVWLSGWYTWAGYVSKSGTRYTFDSGQIEIKPDPASVSAGHDGRSVAQKMVEQLEAALVSYSASQGMVAEYEIAGRRMKFRSAVEILELIRYWKKVRADEDVGARLAAGLGSGRKVYTRFLR